MRGRVKVAGVLALTLVPVLALAHPGDTHVAGFFAGFAHPWTGIDHMAAMLAAGLWLGRIQPRSLPALFGATAIGIVCGVLLGVYAGVLTDAERMVALSAAVFGLFAAAAGRARLPFAAALVALFCVFHGYVHALETPRQLSQIAFTGGFIVAMLTLQFIGALIATKESIMFKLASICVLSVAVCGVAAAGDAAAGKAKVDAVCSKCHEKEDWADQDAAAIQAKIKGVVDGTTKHKEKLKLTEQEQADIAAYWSSK